MSERVNTKVGQEVEETIDESDLGLDIDYKQSIRKISDTYKAGSVLPKSSWIFFIPKGAEASKDDLWKVFLKPQRQYLLKTLSRLIDLANKGSVKNQFKVITNPDAYRSRGRLADDLESPIIVIYTSGNEISLLIKLLARNLDYRWGQPPEKRKIGGSGSIDWVTGPSFTQYYNQLINYGQGGYTESGRDVLVDESDYEKTKRNLSQKFVGNNFYLHRGSHDPFLKCFKGLLWSHNTYINVFEKMLSDPNFKLIPKSIKTGLNFRYGLDSQYGEIKLIMKPNFPSKCDVRYREPRLYDSDSSDSDSEDELIKYSWLPRIKLIKFDSEVASRLSSESCPYYPRNIVSVPNDSGLECGITTNKDKYSWCNTQLHLFCEVELNEILAILVPEFVLKLEVNPNQTITFKDLIDSADHLKDKIIITNRDRTADEYYSYLNQILTSQYYYNLDSKKLENYSFEKTRRESTKRGNSSLVSNNLDLFTEEELIYFDLVEEQIGLDERKLKLPFLSEKQESQRRLIRQEQHQDWDRVLAERRSVTYTLEPRPARSLPHYRKLTSPFYLYEISDDINELLNQGWSHYDLLYADSNNYEELDPRQLELLLQSGADPFLRESANGYRGSYFNNLVAYGIKDSSIRRTKLEVLLEWARKNKIDLNQIYNYKFETIAQSALYGNDQNTLQMLKDSKLVDLGSWVPKERRSIEPSTWSGILPSKEYGIPLYFTDFDELPVSNDKLQTKSKPLTPKTLTPKPRKTDRPLYHKRRHRKPHR